MLNNGVIGVKTESSYFDGKGIVNLNQVASYLENTQWYFGASVNVNATAFSEGETISISINTKAI